MTTTRFMHAAASASRQFPVLVPASLAEAENAWAEGVKDRSLVRLRETVPVTEAAGLRQQLMDAEPLVQLMVECLLSTGSLEPGLRAFSLCFADAMQRPSDACSPSSLQNAPEPVSLTPRERDVLRAIGEGRTNKAIAKQQGVAPETVKSHIKHIFAKLGVERRAQAVSKAERLGLMAV
jgi:LuxR family maltose regulon positive regulatory protein